MQQVNLLVDSADGCLDAGVSRPHLIAVYAELSHSTSVGSRSWPAARYGRICGELGHGERDAESSAATNRLIGNNLAFVSFNNRAHD